MSEFDIKITCRQHFHFISAKKLHITKLAENLCPFQSNTRTKTVTQKFIYIYDFAAIYLLIDFLFQFVLRTYLCGCLMSARHIINEQKINPT